MESKSKSGSKKYLQAVLCLIIVLLISFLWIWWDAVPDDKIEYGYLGTLSKVKSRFALSPLSSLVLSEGFALNFILTFLFIMMLIAIALLPAIIYRRCSSTPKIEGISRKTVCTEICLWLLSIPLAVFFIYSIFNGMAFVILSYLLAYGYLYVHCTLIAKDKVFYRQRRSLLISCTMGFGACVVVLFLLQAVLNAVGIIYRMCTIQMSNYLFILFSYGLMVIIGQEAFLKLNRSASFKSQTGKIGVILLLAAGFMFLVCFFGVMVIFSTDLARDILVIKENGEAYVRVSFSPWFRAAWEERYRHICTFFMAPMP